jgi:hypothetical protein
MVSRARIFKCLPTHFVSLQLRLDLESMLQETAHPAQKTQQYSQQYYHSRVGLFHRLPGCVPITGVRSSFCHPQTVPSELATPNPPRDLESPQLFICSMLGKPLPGSNSTPLSNLSTLNYYFRLHLTPIRQDCTTFRPRACCQLECSLWSILLRWLQVYHKRE